MNWEPFIKASWQLVMESEGKTQIYLKEDLEAYLVHMMARSMSDPGIPPDIICTEFIGAKSKEDFRRIGDSCLFIDAWNVRRAKTVAQDYYENMGRIAYSYAAIRSKPTDELFETVAKNFSFLSKVLKGVKS